MTKDNPNAFKLWISADVVKKYFKNTGLNQKQTQSIINNLDSLELKARVRLIASELKKILPHSYPKALNELLKITKNQKLKSFELWPTTEFIQSYGLEHVDLSLRAMYQLTPLFTAEFSIRPFINKFEDEIYKKLLTWKNDPNDHVRRWLSEGTRPRLPWGEKLQVAVLNPEKGLEILEHLKFDSSLYVRKSVSNHLNDISKDHPDLVVATLIKWKKNVPKGFEKEFQFIVSRALRVMVKNGHLGALKFMGVELVPNSLMCSEFKINKTKLKMGDQLQLNFSVKNMTQKKIKYIIDYVIYFKKSNCELSPKVFKLKTGFIDAGAALDIQKLHSFKPITTRQYYSGEHRVALKINGHESVAQKFDLKI